MKILLTVSALLLAISTAHATTFDYGMAALENRDFPGALSVFGPLAAQNDGNAEFMLGVMHENGLGVTKDLAAAASWYLRAAESGIASAQYNIGVFYQLGKGVAPDARAALKWHARAAAQGHHRAQNNLGTIYYTGAGTTRDSVEAWKWLTLATKGLQGQARDIARQNITAIEKELSRPDLEEAERRVAEWKTAR